VHGIELKKKKIKCDVIGDVKGKKRKKKK